MTKKTEQQEPLPPTAKETEIPTNADYTPSNEGAELTAPDPTPLDPKEIARQRSKEDLQRKRQKMRGSHGKF